MTTSESEAEPQKRGSRRSQWLKLGLSVGISAFFLWLAVDSLAGCPDGLDCQGGACVEPGGDAGACADSDSVCPSCVQWSNLSALLGNVSVASIALFTLGFTVVHIIRIWRWYFMLRPLGLKRFYPALSAGAIGMAAIVIVPLRLGELVRPYVISKTTNVPMSSALGTAVVERVVDGLTVTAMLFLTLTFLPTIGSEPVAVRTAGTISAVIFVSVAIVLAFSWWKREATVRFLAAIGNRVSETLTAKALGLLEGFLDGIATLAQSRRDALGFLLSTVLYWATNAATLVYLANAFGLEISFIEGFAVMSILVIGIMVPGAPGHIGTYEFFFQAGLALYVAIDVMPDRVLAFIATIHILQVLVQALFGVPFLFRSDVSIRDAVQGEGS